MAGTIPFGAPATISVAGGPGPEWLCRVWTRSHELGAPDAAGNYLGLLEIHFPRLEGEAHSRGRRRVAARRGFRGRCRPTVAVVIPQQKSARPAQCGRVAPRL